VKAITAANAQAAHSVSRANAQAAHDAAMLDAIEDWKLSRNESLTDLLFTEGQSRESYNVATSNVYANWENGVGNLLGDKPEGTGYLIPTTFAGGDESQPSARNKDSHKVIARTTVWDEEPEKQGETGKRTDIVLPPLPEAIRNRQPGLNVKLDFTPEEYKEFKGRLDRGEIKPIELPLMYEGMNPRLMNFIYENPEVYQELTRKFGFEYQHKLNALFENNDVVVGYRGYFDPSYNIEAGKVYLDNSRYTFWTAGATTQAERLKDLIDRLGKIEKNVESPILTPGDVASWFDPNRSVKDNLPHVKEEVKKFAKTLAWELGTEVLLEISGTKLAALGGGAALQGGSQASAGAGLAAFLWWLRNRRAANGLSRFVAAHVDEFIDKTADAWVAAGKSKTFVVGEGQKRIGKHIREQLGGDVLEFRNIWPENMKFKLMDNGQLSAADEATLIEFNKYLIRRLHAKGFKFFDIGRDGRGIGSKFYEAELEVLRELGVIF
jgi:hypothetical protein